MNDGNDHGAAFLRSAIREVIRQRSEVGIELVQITRLTRSRIHSYNDATVANGFLKGYHMQCSQCDREVADDAAFCPYCGERMTASVFSPKSARATGSPPMQPGASTQTNRRIRPKPPCRIQQEQTRFGSKDPQEEELWQGSFSPKAMWGQFAAAAVVTTACLVGVAMFWNTHIGWLTVAVGAALLWATAGLTLAYRKLTVHYRLTRFRLFHEHGILTRVTDRIETIDIDDVTVFQGLLERSFDVGTIVVASTDRTSPDLRMRGIDHVKAVADLIDSTRRAERQRRGLHLEST